MLGTAIALTCHAVPWHAHAMLAPAMRCTRCSTHAMPCHAMPCPCPCSKFISEHGGHANAPPTNQPHHACLMPALHPPHPCSKFISEHGGHTNAYTSNESTNYHFDVNWDCLEPALDRCVFITWRWMLRCLILTDFMRMPCEARLPGARAGPVGTACDEPNWE